MWCTTFAFQPWHSAVEFKRYLVRFAHMVSGFNTLTGIMRTVYNQYDSMVSPLHKWLEERGVKFMLKTTVTDIALAHAKTVLPSRRSSSNRKVPAREIGVREQDRVIVTLGSMTEGSSLGSMDSAALLLGKADGGSWALWEKIAASHDTVRASFELCRSN
jgi:oleate hydratase